MSRVIEQEKIDQEKLSRDEALYLRDRGQLPEGYKIPGEEETYENELKSYDDGKLLALARRQGLAPEADAFKTKGKVSKAKLIDALVALREGGPPINPDELAGGTPPPPDEADTEDDEPKTKGKSKKE